MASSESKLVVFVQIGANIGVAAAKFIAAAITGSSAMLAEGFHSTVDTGDGLLLLLGRHRSEKPPDVDHPFGHGLELYFWTFIVALMMFAVGGGVSVYEGVTRIAHPSPLEDPTWSYIVLGVAVLFDGTSFVVAFRKFHKDAGERSVWKALETSKDPSVFTVLLEDSSDLTGILLAFLGVFLSHRLHAPVLDGVASVCIGLVLLAVSVFLGIQSRSLLTGERASKPMIVGIKQLVMADPKVQRASRPLTLQLGPEDVLLALQLQFCRMMSAAEAAEAFHELERSIRERYPVVKHVFVEAPALSESRDSGLAAQGTRAVRVARSEEGAEQQNSREQGADSRQQKAAAREEKGGRR